MGYLSLGITHNWRKRVTSVTIFLESQLQMNESITNKIKVNYRWVSGSKQVTMRKKRRGSINEGSRKCFSESYLLLLGTSCFNLLPQKRLTCKIFLKKPSQNRFWCSPMNITPTDLPHFLLFFLLRDPIPIAGASSKLYLKSFCLSFLVKTRNCHPTPTVIGYIVLNFIDRKTTAQLHPSTFG